MYHFTRVIWLVLLFCHTLLDTNAQQFGREITKGIYGHPGPLWEKGYVLSELGINAVFVHSGSIDSAMVDRARSDGLKVYAEFATLNGKGYVDEYPEAHAINERGEKVAAATWFMGVCPTNAAFREFRLEQLRSLLGKYDLDGVWMDYVHWHAQFEDPEPILVETCFCDDCTGAFELFSGLSIPGHSIVERAQWIQNNADFAWRDWRCQVIADWARDFKLMLNEVRPGALLGLYHCPWQDHEYNHARRKMLGLDYDMLTEVVDVFSPMVYHGRMERPATWVADNIRWHSQRLGLGGDRGPKLWPIVQAHDDPHQISGKEFEAVMLGGLARNASGVMMFTTRSVAKSDSKLEVMKRLYLNDR